MQVPAWHFSEQHWFQLLHLAPARAHWPPSQPQNPLRQSPLQHSVGLLQITPFFWQAGASGRTQVPPWHCPLQHCHVPEQGTPMPWHAGDSKTASGTETSLTEPSGTDPS
jgi:hypothetical protein